MDRTATLLLSCFLKLGMHACGNMRAGSAASSSLAHSSHPKLSMLPWLAGLAGWCTPMQAAAGTALLMPLEEFEAAFWGAKQGPGADMQQALGAARTPEAYADVPKVGGRWVCGCMCFECRYRADD